jgi:hypothetical protein
MMSAATKTPKYARRQDREERGIDRPDLLPGLIHLGKPLTPELSATVLEVLPTHFPTRQIGIFEDCGRWEWMG